MEGVIFEKLAKVAEETGFSGAEILPAAEVVLDRCFRDACAANRCGVNVSLTAAKTSLKYVNGQDTVTYFGIILFNA